MIGFILSTYDRIDDFLAHLDILKHYKTPHKVIPIYMRKDVPEYFLKEIEKLDNISYCDGVYFGIGPLLALCHGLKIAKELGLEWVVYRNGDDWLFNEDFVIETRNVLEKSGYACAAYNWLTVGTNLEFALNELWLHVDTFYKTVEDAEQYFRNATRAFLCELKMAKWIKSVGNFYRLPNREAEPGIGHETEHIEFVLKSKDMKEPKGLQERLKDNSRFFCRKWQLIGSHDNQERYNYYNEIRNDIPYVKELEKEKHFSRWLNASKNNLPWNLKVTYAKSYERRLMAYKQFRENSDVKRMSRKLLKPK